MPELDNANSSTAANVFSQLLVHRILNDFHSKKINYLLAQSSLTRSQYLVTKIEVHVLIPELQRTNLSNTFMVPMDFGE